MRNKLKLTNKKSEQGAALVLVLMVSGLLLVACIGMLTAAALNTKNVTDAVSEDQAYYAAESGLQATINVLRGNTSPSPLFNPTPSNSANKITFTKAVMLSTSNLTSDSSTKARLSRWLSYGSTYTDRIILGTTEASYAPDTGFAYSIEVSDPDNTQNTVTYSSSATFSPLDTEGDGISGTLLPDASGTANSIVMYGDATNNTKIEFVGKSATTLNVSTGVSPDTSLGYFKVTRTGNGSNIIDALRFQIAYSMTVPHTASRYIRGTIYQDNSSALTPKPAYIEFDSDVFVLMGSNITITSNDASLKQPLNRPSAAGGTANSDIRATVTPAEPQRLLIKSIGYGPRGARKQLEAIVQKNFFNDLAAPAALTMIGPKTDSTGGSFVFDPGNSANVLYSGADQASTANIPSIGVVNTDNLQTVLKTSIKTEPNPPAANVSAEIPDWLSSTYNLDAAIQNLKVVAKASGRYYSSGTTPPNFGSLNGTGITFCDGDVSLSGDGGGILVVTGKLTLRGGVDFRGLILVTGAGGLDRSGGGNGSLAGNTVIAPYNPSNLAAGFLAPKYDISGGGTSELVYNSSSVNNGLVAVSNFVLGVAEK